MYINLSAHVHVRVRVRVCVCVCVCVNYARSVFRCQISKSWHFASIIRDCTKKRFFNH